MQRRIPAVFMRGGTSKALFFHREALPSFGEDSDLESWNRIFCAALGSPDPNGRQLDGMGGGMSSLSKIAVIAPSRRPDADVDYTFAQVNIVDGSVSYRANCGNISSAVGPYAVEEGLVPASGPHACVRIYNTNTGKIILSSFPLVDGLPATDGNLQLPGVAGKGASIQLSFLKPGGAVTGRLLPTGNTVDRIKADGLGEIEVSLVDAANPTVFAAASSFGLSGAENPDMLSRDAALLSKIENLRVAAAVAMGFADAGEARNLVRNLPLVSLVAPPRDVATLSGEMIAATEMDILTRMVASGRPHRATPLTAGMCLAIALQIPGTLPQRLARKGDAGLIKIGHPSGILEVGATVNATADGLVAESATVYRTARRLMEGSVLVPESRLIARIP